MQSMKRLSAVTILLIAVYSLIVIGSALHVHQVSSDHLNCKICQVFEQSTLPESKTLLVNEFLIGETKAIQSAHFSLREIPAECAGRAPPALTI